MATRKRTRGEPTAFAYDCLACHKIYVTPADAAELTRCTRCGANDAVFVGNRYSEVWGVADGRGIYGVAPTMKEAKALAGFATPHIRERLGRLYHYTTVEGSEATVGKLSDLKHAGYTLAMENN